MVNNNTYTSTRLKRAGKKYFANLEKDPDIQTRLKNRLDPGLPTGIETVEETGENRATIELSSCSSVTKLPTFHYSIETHYNN